MGHGNCTVVFRQSKDTHCQWGMGAALWCSGRARIPTASWAGRSERIHDGGGAVGGRAQRKDTRRRWCGRGQGQGVHGACSWRGCLRTGSIQPLVCVCVCACYGLVWLTTFRQDTCMSVQCKLHSGRSCCFEIDAHVCARATRLGLLSVRCGDVASVGTHCALSVAAVPGAGADAGALAGLLNHVWIVMSYVSQHILDEQICV